MISIIVAVSENNVIGKNNALIWRLPADMKFFKEKTTGHCVITGRKNYDSIPEQFRPLPGRKNIVVTRQKSYEAPGSLVVGSIEQALDEAKKTGDDEVFIIGGAEIYNQTLNIANKIYLTRIHDSFEGDAFFPELDFNKWKLIESVFVKADEKNKYDFTFETYQSNS